LREILGLPLREIEGAPLKKLRESLGISFGVPLKILKNAMPLDIPKNKEGPLESSERADECPSEPWS
jgi:hypothetical protein